MKASSHEKHAKQQWKKQNTTKKIKSSDPWARSGERPGRGHGSELFVFLFFWFFHGFLQFGQNLDKTKKKSSDPWARSGLSTNKPKKNKKTKKPKNQKNKKPKKTKKQETKKPKKQKKTQKTNKNKIAHPQGGGVRCRVLGLVFLFFLFFLVFCFFVFLVCVWIAIADVPSRDCQALSVVALEARSIHYSTAMFAMT